MTAATPATAAWPSQPYRGLSHYGPDDAPVFGGRDDDVRKCARLLATSGTRLLLVHGPTGCGKSSFLRAGLIPYLERTNASFEFLKEIVDGKAKSVFVRSTDAPIRTLAEKLWGWCSVPRERRDPDESAQHLPLKSALNETQSAAEFIRMCAADSAVLVRSLEKVAAVLPRTLVIVIDQAEEVFTLKPKKDGQDSRTAFFKFLRTFLRSQFDLRLILTFRTEYFGQFDTHINESNLGNISATRGYSLPEFDRERLIDAIKLPTRRTEIPGLGAPYQEYGFSYADNVPEQIADKIEETLQCGKLAAMQIVCRRLYELTREQRDTEHWEISAEHLELLGGVEGQLDAYITDALVRPCRDAKFGGSQTLQEVVKWRSVLYQLTYRHPDDTVTTRLLCHADFSTVAEKADCKIPFEKMAPRLWKEDPNNSRVLLRTLLIDPETDKEVAWYSLAHDVLGLTLQKWHREQEKTIRLGRLLGSAMAITGTCLIAVGVALIIWGDGLGPIRLSVLILGALLILARFKLHLTDWLTEWRYYFKVVFFLLGSKRQRAAMIRDRRFRVYLDMLPGTLSFLQKSLVRRNARLKSTNYWLDYKESDTALVLVHGIFSDSTDFWTAAAAPGKTAVSWPQLIQSDPHFENAGIYMAGYYTLLRTGPSDIRECSNVVFSALNRREPERTPVMARKKLLFLCHATGGIVIKHMLDSNHPAFRDKFVSVVVIGAVEYKSDARWRNFFNKDLNRDLGWSKQFRWVDDRFRAMLENNRIPNAWVQYAFEPGARLAVRPETIRYLLPTVYLAGVDHFSCVRPDSLSHPSHQLLVEAYQRLSTTPAAAPGHVNREPFMAPPKPTGPLIERADLLAKLTHDLQPGASIAIYGPRGTGKTSLVLQAVYQPELRTRFAAGVFWASLGSEIDPLAVLGRWCAALGVSEEEIGAMKTPQARKNCLQNLMAYRSFLVVMDDVPSLTTFEMLMPRAPHGLLAAEDVQTGAACLVTTEDVELARAISPERCLEVGAFTEAESVALLQKLGVASKDLALKTAAQASFAPLSVTLLGRLAARAGALVAPEPARLLSDNVVEEAADATKLMRAPSPAPKELLWAEDNAIRLSVESLIPKVCQLLRTLAELPAKPNNFAQAAALTSANTSDFNELARSGLLEALGAGRCAIDRAVHAYIRKSAVQPDPEILQALVEYHIAYIDTHRLEYGALEIESQNISAALELARANRWVTSYIKGALSFGSFLEVRGAYQQAALLYKNITSFAHQAGDTNARAFGLIGHGRVCEKLARYSEAKDDLEKALTVAESTGDVNTAASARAALGEVLDTLGEVKEAMQVLDQGLQFDRQRVNPETVIDLLARRGRMATGSQEFELSDRYNTEALKLARESADLRRVAVVLTNLSMLEYSRRNLQQARQYAEEGLEIARKIGFNSGLAGLLHAMGVISAASGQPEPAEAFFKEGLDLAESIGHRWYAREISAAWGDLLSNLKRTDEAEAMFQRAQGHREALQRSSTLAT